MITVPGLQSRELYRVRVGCEHVPPYEKLRARSAVKPSRTASVASGVTHAPVALNCGKPGARRPLSADANGNSE